MLALLLTVGAAAGFGASWAVGENPSGTGAAVPVVATSPSLPIDPVPELLPDPTTPALAAGLPLVRQAVGTGSFRMTLPLRWPTPSALCDASWRKPAAA